MSINDELIPCPICEASGELPGDKGLEQCVACKGEMQCSLGAALRAIVHGQKTILRTVISSFKYIESERQRKL